MQDMIEKLERLGRDLDSMRTHLKEQEWPSRAITLIANDLGMWLGMADRSAETLTHLLVGLERSKAEPKLKPEVKEALLEKAQAQIQEGLPPTEEEEESGEVPSEQVSEPEDGEASDQIPPQESGDEKPPGD